ncbi:MAG: hypothetical protein ACK559_06980, partial [bacterium]
MAGDPRLARAPGIGRPRPAASPAPAAGPRARQLRAAGAASGRARAQPHARAPDLRGHPARRAVGQPKPLRSAPRTASAPMPAEHLDYLGMQPDTERQVVRDLLFSVMACNT